jgi:hypothetical protein
MRENELFLPQEVPGNRIDSQENRGEGKNYRKNGFCVKPFIQLEPPEDPKKDDRQHLESNA